MILISMKEKALKAKLLFILILTSNPLLMSFHLKKKKHYVYVQKKMGMRVAGEVQIGEKTYKIGEEVTLYRTTLLGDCFFIHSRAMPRSLPDQMVNNLHGIYKVILRKL